MQFHVQERIGSGILHAFLCGVRIVMGQLACSFTWYSYSCGTFWMHAFVRAGANRLGHLAYIFAWYSYRCGTTCIRFSPNMDPFRVQMGFLPSGKRIAVCCPGLQVTSLHATRYSHSSPGIPIDPDWPASWLADWLAGWLAAARPPNYQVFL